MCNQLHSIINSGLIPGGQNLSNRQTVFFLFVDPEEHKDPDTIELEAPRLAQYMHKAWDKHQNTVYWVDINFALKKRLNFYQARSNAIILHETARKMFLLLKVKRPVPTRSMIKVCTKNLVLQIDRGNLRNCLKTSVLSMLTMDQGNLWSKSAQARTQWKNNLLLKKIVTLRQSTRTRSSTVQSTRRTLTSTFQEYHILQWNDHKASTFEIWFWRSRTTLSDMHFKVIFNNIDNSTLSAKNHKTWLKQLETLNCVNYSMLNAKRSVGTSASSIARAVTSYEMIRQRTRSTSSRFLPLFDSPLLHQERSTTRSPIRKERRWSRISHCESAQEEMQEKRFLEYSRSFYPWWDSERPWSKWIALKKWFARWTNWRTRITHTTLPKNKSMNTAAIGDTFEFWFRHDARKASSWFQRSSLPCVASRIKRIKLITKIDGKALPHPGGIGQNPGASFIWDIIATMDPALIDRGNLRKQWLG